MSRDAIMYIQNETGHELKFVSSETEHGKFEEDPPTSIGVGAKGKFKVTNTGMVGPKGKVVYRLELSEGIFVNLTYHWDHPYGNSSSSYTMGSSPAGYASYYIDPPNPEGHDQEITFFSRLNDKGVDPAKWMAKVKKSTKLRDIILPGSHDSGTYALDSSSYLCLDADNQILVFASNVWIASQWAKAQSNSILSQLNSGIRYLDIRVSDGHYNGLVIQGINIDNTTGGPVICHSVGITQPEEIFKDIKTFLDTNASEVIVMNIQHCYHKQADATVFYNDLIADMKIKFGSKMVERTSINNLTMQYLSDNKKQIIVMFDQDHLVETTLSPSEGIPFADAYPGIYVAEKEIWSSKEYLSNVWTDSSSASLLHTRLTDVVNKQMPGDSQLFVLQGVVTPDTGMYLNAIDSGLPKSLEELGNMVTPQVESWVFNEWSSKRLNIIMCDWVSGSDLMQQCYLMNSNKGLLQ